MPARYALRDADGTALGAGGDLDEWQIHFATLATVATLCRVDAPICDTCDAFICITRVRARGYMSSTRKSVATVATVEKSAALSLGTGVPFAPPNLHSDVFEAAATDAVLVLYRLVPEIVESS
jgi:hypothetical protein